jgi:anti-anti-sigma regulatory factor
LIPVADDVLIMPVVGNIDEERAQTMLETLLSSVGNSHATIVIIDITGVHSVDTHVADGLLQMARAVRLLGARVILTGIGPHIAQAFVELGIRLDDLSTFGTLQAAIAVALRVRR